jgi:hypothetical protein
VRVTSPPHTVELVFRYRQVAAESFGPIVHGIFESPYVECAPGSGGWGPELRVPLSRFQVASGESEVVDQISANGEHQCSLVEHLWLGRRGPRCDQIESPGFQAEGSPPVEGVGSVCLGVDKASSRACRLRSLSGEEFPQKRTFKHEIEPGRLDELSFAVDAEWR